MDSRTIAGLHFSGGSCEYGREERLRWASVATWASLGLIALMAALLDTSRVLRRVQKVRYEAAEGECHIWACSKGRKEGEICYGSLH